MKAGGIMENSLHLKIITPNKTFYDGDIDSVIVKTTGGERQILKNRRPFTAEIIEGNIKIKSEKSTELVYSTGGFISSEYGNVVILTKMAKNAD